MASGLSASTRSAAHKRGASVKLPVVDLSRFRIDGVKAELGHHRSADCVDLMVHMRVYDVTTGSATTTSSRTTVPVRLATDAVSFKSYIAHTIRESVLHELMECTVIDGERLDDPHPMRYREPRPAGEWKRLEPECYCPRTQRDISMLLVARAEEYDVCELAFANLCDAWGFPRSDKRDVFILPHPPDRFGASFAQASEQTVMRELRIRRGHPHR